ncbi:MAG: OmpA family protein [Rudanella sp.]|nr:OmpA family protein [Rudanella sp.]
MTVCLYFSAFLIIFLSAFGPGAWAQNNRPSLAILDGTVVNARTRLPIAGATVRAKPLSEPAASTSSQTAPDGSFSLKLDPAQTYAITTSAEGYNDREEKLAFSDQRADRLYGKEIRLEPGSAAKPTMPVVLPTIQFSPRRSDLSVAATTILQQVAALLETHSTVRIEAAGHTDTIGDISLNRILASDRAEAVRAFLVQLGTNKARIDVRSYGGGKPLPGPLSLERRAQNKRVELIVLPSSQPQAR